MALWANITRRIGKCEVADFSDVKPLHEISFEILQVDLFTEERKISFAANIKILSILAIHIPGATLEQVSFFLPF